MPLRKSSVFLGGLAALGATLAATPASSVILRHDVPSREYLATERPEALVNMPGQGHGVLIDPEWIVTAAHLIFRDYRGRTILVDGVEHEIETVVIHPGYARPEAGIFSGDSAPSQAYLRGNHDIALIKLASPSAARPIPLYRGNEEAGHRFDLYGKGNTGTGLSGQISRSGGTLRQAENTIGSADGQWLFYDFNAGGEGLPLEGFQGDGDSGGPAMIDVEGKAFLAGLVSWDVYNGDLANFKGGLYGMSGALVRMSYYADWIDAVIADDAAAS